MFCCWPWFKLFKLLSCGLLLALAAALVLALAAALVLALALAATASVSLEFLEHTSDSLDSAARSLPWCRATVQSSIHGSDIVGEGTLKQKEIGYKSKRCKMLTLLATSFHIIAQMHTLWALIWYWDHLKNFIAEIPQGPLVMSIGTIWVTPKRSQGPPAMGF